MMTEILEPQVTEEETALLPEEFEKSGFYYNQEFKNDDWYIYRKTYLRTGRPVGFEVFHRRIAMARKLFGNSVPKREVYPSNEDFGRTAWACRTYGEAIKKASS